MTNYSGTKCPKCENTTFEVVEDAPFNSKFIVNYIRCMSCKSLITVVPYYDINTQLKIIATALNVKLD